ncbi:MAG: YtxH domain-containing protein [Leucobacter sp.]
MKGKIAFVLGAAVGYVLGTRAGRERYEQIKSGTKKVWETAPVQRGVGAVRNAAQTRVDELKDAVVRAIQDAFASFSHRPPAEDPAAKSAAHAAGVAESSAADPTAPSAPRVSPTSEVAPNGATPATDGGDAR